MRLGKKWVWWKAVFEPFLRNVPPRLSIPVAFLVLNSFNIFKIDTELTFSNLSFFSCKFNPLCYWRTEGIPNFSAGSGSFLARSVARFTKSVCSCSMRERQRFFLIEACLLWRDFCLANSVFFIILQSSFGCTMFSGSFSCKKFLFYIWLKLARYFWLLFVVSHPHLSNIF